MPLVSVVIPTFNRAHLIISTIQSVLAQTVNDIEVIISDDGSTDHTSELVSNIFGHDTRIKYIKAVNSERAIARNRAILVSLGQYISFIDADDLWSPNKLELQLLALSRHPNLKCCFHQYQVIPHDTNVPPTIISETNPIILEKELFPSIVFSNSIGSMTPLIHKSVLAEVGLFTTEPSLIGFEDWELWTRISAKYKWLEVPLVLGYWRSHLGNTQRAIHPSEEITRLYCALAAARSANRTLEIEKHIIARSFVLYSQTIHDNPDCARQFLALASGLASVKPSFARQLLCFYQLNMSRLIRKVFGTYK